MEQQTSPPLVEYFQTLLGPQNTILPDSKAQMEDYIEDMGNFASDPLIVLQPETEEQVSKIVEYARRTKTPVVARGAGTSLTGASSSHGGIVIDFSKRMNKILKIDPVNWYVHCQPGITLEDLNETLKKQGFFFPPDPASSTWCTVGGAISENSGGMRCFRYGTVKDWVLAIRVVLSDGSKVKFGEPLPKNRVGYDFVHLMCGSEGTLGIITEAWLKVIPLPKNEAEHKRLLVFFDDWPSAGKAIQAIRASKIQPVLLEFMEKESLHAVNAAFDLKVPESEAVLFMEIDFDPSQLLKLCEENGATGSYVAKDAADYERLYNARALAYLGIREMAPSFHTEDVVVPLERLAEYLALVRQISKKYDLQIPTDGHAGDGNVHPVILFDKSSKDSVERAEKAFAEICNYAIEVGGSVTGEHGVGEQKISFALEQLRRHNGEETIQLMKKIKQLWDPDNILNPGKFQ